jgi:hypothetical protein
METKTTSNDRSEKQQGLGCASDLRGAGVNGERRQPAFSQSPKELARKREP